MTPSSRFPTHAYDPLLLEDADAAPEKRPAHCFNRRQRLFVEEYLIDLNAEKAAIRAGYGKRSAHVHGPRLLRYPHVAAAIEEALEVRAERTRVTSDRVLLELARIAFSDVARIVRWNDQGISTTPSDKLTPDERAAISEVTVVVDTAKGTATTRASMHGKQGALALLAQHVGLVGRFARLPAVESPAAAADRARALILARLDAMDDARREAEAREAQEDTAGELDDEP